MADNSEGGRKQVLATKLSALRRDRGWSQAELARRAGLNRNVINTAEQQTSFPSIKSLDAIARALSVPVEALTNVTIERDMRRHSSLDILEVSSKPGFAFLQLNRLVRSETALKIYQLLSEDDPEQDPVPA